MGGPEAMQAQIDAMGGREAAKAAMKQQGPARPQRRRGDAPPTAGQPLPGPSGSSSRPSLRGRGRRARPKGAAETCETDATHVARLEDRLRAGAREDFLRRQGRAKGRLRGPRAARRGGREPRPRSSRALPLGPPPGRPPARPLGVNRSPRPGAPTPDRRSPPSALTGPLHCSARGTSCGGPSPSPSRLRQRTEAAHHQHQRRQAWTICNPLAQRREELIPRSPRTAASARISQPDGRGWRVRARVWGCGSQGSSPAEEADPTSCAGAPCPPAHARDTLSGEAADRCPRGRANGRGRTRVLDKGGVVEPTLVRQEIGTPPQPQATLQNTTPMG